MVQLMSATTPRRVITWPAVRSVRTVEFGERFSLYAVIAQEGPVTAAQLAAATNLPERDAAAWLAAQAAAQYLVRDPATGRYASWCDLPGN